MSKYYFNDDTDLILTIMDGGVLQIDHADPSWHPRDLWLEVDHIFPKTSQTLAGIGYLIDHVGNYRLVVLPINRRKGAQVPDKTTDF